MDFSLNAEERKGKRRGAQSFCYNDAVSHAYQFSNPAPVVAEI